MIGHSERKRILVLGASGMLGNAVMRVFSQSKNFEAVGASRSKTIIGYVSSEISENLVFGHDLENQDHLVDLLGRTQPDVVINCVGLVKQLEQASDPIQAIPLNSILPHRLARLCGISRARLIHMSTDCVFSGSQGNYTESDNPDSNDLYGRSKLLGEVDYQNAITVRTSIIGHELNGNRSLVNWFLSQRSQVKGYSRAVFSGLPTVEIACLMRDFIIPNPKLRGLYHVSAEPINKFDLLSLIAKEYGISMDIQPDDSLVIDRSLNSTRFCRETGYIPDAWPDLIRKMHKFQ